MRKGLIYPLLSMAVAASLLAGCTGGQQSKDYKEEKDSVTVFFFVLFFFVFLGVGFCLAFYGHMGEGTGMSSLELITADGDTLALNKTNEKTGEPGRILGEIANYTDQYAITTCDDNQSVNVALNINQLAQRKWQSDTDKQHGFQLEMNGKARSLATGPYKYNQWSLYNCKLILLRESEGIHGAETRNDTLDILKLTPDSLVLQSSRTSIPEKFHRIS